jgi:biotin synthase
MMGRWGLEGMRSFEQPSVQAKEGDRLRKDTPTTASSTPSAVDLGAL